MEMWVARDELTARNLGVDPRNLELKNEKEEGMREMRGRGERARLISL